MITDTVFLAACAAAAVLLGLQLPKMRQQWRNARGVIELTEHEHDRDAIAVTCDACSDPSGMGACTCTARCGHRLCRGRRLRAAWNDDDPAWAAAMGIDLEGSGQQ